MQAPDSVKSGFGFWGLYFWFEVWGFRALILHPEPKTLNPE